MFGQPATIWPGFLQKKQTFTLDIVSDLSDWADGVDEIAKVEPRYHHYGSAKAEEAPYNLTLLVTKNNFMH